MIKKLLVAFTALTLASFLLVACGGDDEDSSSSETTPATSSETGGSGGGETISFTAEDEGLAYTETEVTAAAGPATIEFDNPASTVHDVAIEDESGETIAQTDTIAGDTATASAELEAGTYTFYCSVDSHREAGMEGTLTVE